ncbi:metallophosphoesterase [Streptococcus saliviloxodontae]|uniref:Phosphoesterase n=1 Tax=Streptococcus saliviloxodontae TaxID=1349416 RepID=A0ABS2PN55_9STRE|nr:metallophosphoesterase [Streptococcus saliviloxodontae]MBM7636860.1 putative phosphoesterase [Streptococcus saliviloxodontae]
MTRLAIMSDLHIDLNQFGDFELETLKQVLSEEGISHLHLAGDISNHHYTTSLPFMKTIGEQVKLTYNLGNHDMLDLDEKTIQTLDFQVHNLGSCYLLAFHGWYDYSFSPEKSFEQNLAFKNRFWFDRRLKRDLSDPDITKKVLEKLDKHLSQLDKPVIIAMHFVPHSDFTMTHATFKPFNAFLGSQAFHDLFSKHRVADVVFGHVHRSYGTQVIDGIRYHSRPLGYIREWDLTIDYVSKHPELNPTGTWNLSKRYNLVKKRPDYQDYQKQHFKEELKKSMTVFDV